MNTKNLMRLLGSLVLVSGLQAYVPFENFTKKGNPSAADILPFIKDASHECYIALKTDMKEFKQGLEHIGDKNKEGKNIFLASSQSLPLGLSVLSGQLVHMWSDSDDRLIDPVHLFACIYASAIRAVHHAQKADSDYSFLGKNFNCRILHGFAVMVAIDALKNLYTKKADDSYKTVLRKIMRDALKHTAGFAVSFAAYGVVNSFMEDNTTKATTEAASGEQQAEMPECDSSVPSAPPAAEMPAGKTSGETSYGKSSSRYEEFASR